MASVEPGGSLKGDNELRSIGVGASVAHVEDPPAHPLQLPIDFVAERLLEDSFAAGAVAVGDVAPLAHVTGDDAVKHGALVVEFVPAVSHTPAVAEVDEVLHGGGGVGGVQLHFDPTHRLTGHGHVEEDARVDLGQPRDARSHLRVHLRSGLEGRRCDVLLHREDGRCDEEAGLGRREREGGREGEGQLRQDRDPM